MMGLNHVSDHSSLRIDFAKPLCGERRDAFVIDQRITERWTRSIAIHITEVQSTPDNSTITTTWHFGFYELSKAHQLGERTQPRHHASDPGKTTLPEGHTALANLFERLRWSQGKWIRPTSNNKAARWKALLFLKESIRLNKGRDPTGSANITALLRGPDCCLQCAVDQALDGRRRCFLIL